MTTLAVERDHLSRNGQPHLIISGAMHYFRVHPDLWADRLKRLVALGCNTVETYVAWNFHAPAPDRTHFEGWADLGRYLDLAAELGLDAIVRPGPYICAEWEGGGLPGWLMADPTMRLRCCDPRYLAAVDRWFDALVPILVVRQANRGGNVIAVQVENEYGSFGDDRAYLEYLRDGLRSRGIDELLVTSDGPGHFWLSGGRVEGAWSTVNFGSRVPQVLELCKEELPNQPQMCMEFWNGWFDHWGEEHHVRSPESVAHDLDDMLSAGMSVNFYMAHGGTNFGLWAGANHDGTLQPTVTSYDYDAPIAEDGRLTAKFHAVREVIGRYRSLPPLADELAALGIDASPRAMAAQPLPWRRHAALRSLPLWREGAQEHACPPPFESMGLERGAQVLRRELELEVNERGLAPLVVHGLADRATVFIDGIKIGQLVGGDSQATLELEPWRDQLLGEQTRRTVEVELLVENLARINFGPRLGARKGILGGIWHHVRYLNNWQVLGLPWESLGARLASEAMASQPSQQLPMVAMATLTTPGGLDAHLDVSRCGYGIAWVDDFCLGRYWHVGPQRSLYIPAPLLTAGEHRVTIVEFECADATIGLAPGLDLGDPGSN